jgi:hypothetical protein
MRLTDNELSAITTALGFIQAGELEETTDKPPEWFETAHLKISRERERRRLKGEQPDPRD